MKRSNPAIHPRRQWPGQCAGEGRSLNCRVFGSRPALSTTCPHIPSTHRSGHRRRQAPGPQHCPGIGRRGWQVAVHYRASAQDAMDTVAACADLAGASAHFDADFEDEAAVRGLVPRVIAHFGQLDAVVNSASLFEHDDVQTFGFAAGKAPAQQHGHARAAGPGAAPACGRPRGGGRGRCARRGGQPAGPEALEPEPRLHELHALESGAGGRGHHAGLALAPRVRVVGVAPA